MEYSVEQVLETVPFCFGQILIRKIDDNFVLCHRDDQAHRDLQIFQEPEDAIGIARYDDAGKYRPLKTARNLRHGWRMELRTSDGLKRALDHFYPGRLAIFVAWKTGQLRATPLRETLDRQSGMYRVAAKISDSQVDRLVADFCRSNDGCLRTILWKRDQRGAIASTRLPKEKFNPTCDQVQAPVERGESALAETTTDQTIFATIPLLCQEPCNLLVAACRNVVKSE
jgi:hypothetical protein